MTNIAGRVEFGHKQVYSVPASYGLRPITKEDFEKIQIGDKVYTSYFGLLQPAIVIKKGRTNLRLRFRNASGWTVEHTRHYEDCLLKIEKKEEASA